MPGIYDRDNYAQLMQTALNNAYNRREATQRQRAERVKEIVAAGGDFAKVLGRTAEEWDVPDQYKDDPDYRAARFDYVLGGDRSGLDAYRQAEMQAEQARRQQEFTAAENALNRKMQMAENEKNRAVQAKQQSDNRTTEKARLLANIRTAQAIVNDARDNPSRYTPLDIAKANSDLELQHDLAEKSGWFTAEEMRKIKGLSEPVTPKRAVVPFKPGYTPGMAPQQAPAGEPQETTASDWALVSPEVERLFNEAKTSKDIAAADKRMKELEKDWGNSKEYEGLLATGNKNRERVKNAESAAAKKKARIDTAKTFTFSKTAVRKALDMGKEGGGATSGKVKFDYEFGGKTYSADANIERDGKQAKVIVDGETVQTIPLF